jgi:hypothetical protein
VRAASILALLAACSDYEFVGDAGEAGGEAVDDCLEEGPPALTDPGRDEECLNQPPTGTFTPVVEWQWSSNPVHSGYHQVMSTPAIGPLLDTDLDGDVDEHDVPAVVFTTFTGSAYTSAGALVAVSGLDGSTLWSVVEAGGTHPYGSGGVAIGDLEGDGYPDVCVAGMEQAVLCLEGDGSFKWASGPEPGYVGAPAIADMDGDGDAEVVFGRQVLDSDGTLLGLGEYGLGYASFSFPVDLDDDGKMEVVAGNSVYDLRGGLVWTDGLADGIPAVGDFDLDGSPEIVRAGSSLVTLVDAQGTLVWQASVPGGGGGAPTVADYDGDGYPEVGVAGLSYYTLYDTDGSVLWSRATEDDSSSVTGSAVFDFEGDGRAEVVYADEHNLFVYDGRTGAVLLQHDGHASGTLFEYPLVADVDGDGSTEIVVPSNNYAWSGWNGITVIGDQDSSWAPARPVWNQFAYHISNIDADASVPASPAHNWESWNSFRAGGTELGPSHWLADLAGVDAQLCVAECEADRVSFYLSVENSGLLDARDFGVQVQSLAGTVLVDEAVASLAAGTATALGPFTVMRSDWGAESLVLLVDPDGAVAECDETDNRLDLGLWPCD